MSDDIKFTNRLAMGHKFVLWNGNSYLISATGVMCFDVPVEKPVRRRPPSLGQRIKKILSLFFP